MKITYLDRPSYLPDSAIQRLNQLGEFVLYDDMPSEEEAIKRLSDTDIAIVEWTDISSEMINRILRLQYIVLVTTGYEFVDIKAAKQKGILVSNTPNYSRQSVAEHVFGQIISLNKKMCQADSLVRSSNGEADYTQHSIGTELFGQTLGILGLGSIGSWVARIGNGFGMNVVGFNRSEKNIPSVEQLSLHDVLQTSDVISVCLSVNQATIGLLDRKALSFIKPSSILVNIASNKVLDEQTVMQLLEDGGLRGAAFDHVIDTSLLKYDNVLLTPGTAWYTQASLDRNVNMFVASVEQFIKGTPQYLVNS